MVSTGSEPERLRLVPAKSLSFFAVVTHVAATGEPGVETVNCTLTDSPAARMFAPPFPCPPEPTARNWSVDPLTVAVQDLPPLAVTVPVTRLLKLAGIVTFAEPSADV